MGNKHALYICPYCKEVHETPGGLARCILVCEDKIKIEEEARQKAKLAAEKEARYKEVIDAYENFEEFRSKYVDDYGSFTFKTTKEEDLYNWTIRTLGIF
jgi:hypothetical protein